MRRAPQQVERLIGVIEMHVAQLHAAPQREPRRVARGRARRVSHPPHQPDAAGHDPSFYALHEDRPPPTGPLRLERGQ